MQNIAMLVTQDLDFNMLRIFEIFFNVKLVIAKRLLCFRTRPIVCIRQFIIAVDDAHATTTAAHCGFDHNRIAVFMSNILNFFQ